MTEYRSTNFDRMYWVEPTGKILHRHFKEPHSSCSGLYNMTVETFLEKTKAWPSVEAKNFEDAVLFMKLLER